MLLVLINWLYAFITMYISGRFVLKRIYRFFKYEKEADIFASTVTGIALTTAYAGYFSLFAGVGVIANVILIITRVIFFLIDKEDYFNQLKSVKNVSAVQVFVFIAIVLVAAFFTMEGDLFWDTGLYHCQTIRWIEEYGVVKGLGNLLRRLAYNSSFFCQCALYSFKAVCGQSLHTLSGFYTLVMMLYAVFGFKSFRSLPALRLLPFVYFIIICSEMVSPASDFPLVNLIIFVTLRWFQNIDECEKSEVPYSLLCVLVVFIISVKLSVGVLVLLVLAPAVILIRKKKIKDIIAYIIMGIIISAPYFIRNVYISGWLIYPFESIDLFNFDWKMAKEIVKGDADEMLLWGRGLEHGGSLADPISIWLPSWWNNIYTPQQRLIAAAGVSGTLSILLGIIRLVTAIVKKIKDKLPVDGLLEKYGIAYSYYEAVIVCCLIFWLFKSPGIRYGMGYVITMTIVFLQDIITNVILYNKSRNTPIAALVKSPFSWVGAITVVIFICSVAQTFKDYFLWNYECMRYHMKYDCFVKQEDYPVVAAKIYTQIAFNLAQ